MRTYYFEDLETGEEFFVESESLRDARETAYKYFTEPNYLGEVTEQFAEMAGFDTYQVSKKKCEHTFAAPADLHFIALVC